MSEPTEQDFKVMSLRVKHLNWQVRRRAYQQLHDHLQEVTSLKQEFKINSQVTSILNNLTQQKHPTIVLKGLDCVLTIIGLNHSAIKYFNQLVSEGMEKFPLLTQQRKQILEKFMELLYFFKDEQHIVATLNSKLALPNEKAVMWAIQVIGALEVNALRPKLVDISKKHPKLDVKELAAEIAGQLEGDEILPVRKEEPKQKISVSRPVAVSRKEQPRRVTQILQKLHHYEQMPSKEQQRFSDQVLQITDNLCELPMSPQLTNFSYFVQLMIEDNNQIISTNGVKILTSLVDSRSALLPTSYPLLFVFRKFKLHKTHATNLNLLRLVQALVCSNRSNDLMTAVLEGMGGVQNKTNIKYGCTVAFLRVFCYYFGEEKLFRSYCIGEYREELGERIENRKYVEKMLVKCAESFVREKEKQYIPAIERVKEILGMKPTAVNEPKSTKSIANDSKEPTVRRSTANQSTKTQPLPKLSSTSKSTKSRSALIVSPEGELNKILQLTKSSKCSEANLRKAMDKCLKCLTDCVEEQVYDMFFYCQILQSMIDNYQPDQRWDEMVSLFLIDYLKIVSGMEFKESKRKSKIVKNGVDYLLQIGITKLALGKELNYILDKLHESVGFDVIFKSLGDILVMQGEVCKKKNKKQLNRWLQEHVSEEYLDNQYEELKEPIQKKNKSQQPPSIINIPSYQELKAEPKMEDRPIFKKKLEYKREEAEELRRIEEEERLRQQQEEEQLRRGKELELDEYRQNQRIRMHEQDLKPPKSCQKLDMFQNADISHIERVQQQQTERIDEKWEYFLNKKGLNLTPLDHHEDTFKIDREEHGYEEQKFNFSEHQPSVDPQQMHTYKFDKMHYEEEPQEVEQRVLANAKDQRQKLPTFRKHEQEDESQRQQQDQEQPSFKIQQDRFQLQQSEIKPSESGIKRYYQPEQEEQDGQHQQKHQQFRYVYLDAQRIIYMLANSGKSFSHLRTLVFNPFRKNTNKHAFLRELTHLIQHQQINKPQPFKSLLLLVIILFTQIRNDKSVIGPLQFLYEHMAQMCTNNEFLKIIIGLYHCVIEESEEGDRKMLLTILNKSIVRIMPYVENAWEMLKDFQQFYQIGQLVYFEMYAQEYMQIRETLQGSDSLEVVVGKACEEEGENLLPMVEGWLDTNFKKVVRSQIECWLAAQEQG